jgi:hypothetical protein
MTQIAPPMATPRNLDPKLPAEPTLLGPPDLKIPSPNDANFGDPLAKMMTGSGGPGGGGGIGTGEGGGIGSGTGGGLGPGSGGGTGGELSVPAPEEWDIRRACIVQRHNIPKMREKPNTRERYFCKLLFSRTGTLQISKS